MASKIPVMYIDYRLNFGEYQNYIYDSMISESEKSYFTGVDNDMLLLDLLKEKANAYPTFYFFHTGGSHVPFKIRSPADKKVFSKKSVSDVKEQTLNEYDDSILYTDNFLEQLDKIAKKRKQKTGRDYVIWYISDHSLALFKDSSHWSTYVLDKQSLIGRDVPFFILNRQALKCSNRLPKQEVKDRLLNTTQTFYWVLGSLCLYDGNELNVNPPLIAK